MKLFYLYYNQPEAIKNLEAIGYDSMPYEVVIIDDASKPKLDCDWATTYRIRKDVPWNMSKANNFGFSKLDPNDIILRCDMDHWFSLEDLDKLANIDLKPKQVIKFNRIVHKTNGGCYDTKTPVNIYLGRVGDLIEVGGYNEAFCGNYGYEDKEFMHRLEKNGFDISIHPTIKSHCNDWMFTKGLERDASINRELYLELTK